MSARFFPSRWWAVACLLMAMAFLWHAGTTVLWISADAPHTELPDLHWRFEEQKHFETGVYPNRRVSPQLPKDVPGSFSVYPPYTFALQRLWFFPWLAEETRWTVGKWIVSALGALGLSAACLVAWRVLRGGGKWLAWIGVFAVLSVTANWMNFKQGNYALLVHGLTALSFLAWSRERWFAGETAWAFSLLKPQMALTFSVNVLERGWKNVWTVLPGVIALWSLDAWVCHRCGMTQAGLWWEVFGRGSHRYATAHSLFGGMYQLSPLALRLGMIAMAVAGFGLLAWAMRRGFFQQPLLLRFATCGVIGRVAFYHFPYDNMMVWWLVLAALDAWRRRGDTSALWIAGIVQFSLMVPRRWVWDQPAVEIICFVLWAAALLALWQLERRHMRLQAGCIS